MAERFTNVPIQSLIIGGTLPVSIYLYIDFRFITFRGAGDKVDRATYDRLEFKRIGSVFIREEDQKNFDRWSNVKEDAQPPAISVEEKAFRSAREDVHRKAMDIFQATHPDAIVRGSLDTSKKLVMEVMRSPFTVRALTQLQTYSRGTVDHSVNVSVLATYLAMQMGYSHQLILQHVGMAGLLHDVGKTQIMLVDGDSPATVAEKLRAHPAEGVALLDRVEGVSSEVKMIVGQHHECHDGTGYPNRLRANQIYDLARIVNIANHYDELVSQQEGTLAQRQKAALKILADVDYRKFDPMKLEKCLKILKVGV